MVQILGSFFKTNTKSITTTGALSSLAIMLKKILFGSLGYVYYYRGHLCTALAVPFLMLILLDMIDLLEPNIILILFKNILSVLIQTLFAIVTHRIILLGPEAVPKWGLMKWTRRETLFILHVIGIAAAVMPASLLIVITPGGGWIAVLAIYCWIVGRFSLVFPAIAVGDKVSFGTSWALTKNYQPLMFIVVMIFPLFLAIPAILISYIPFFFFLASAISTLAAIFVVATLSITYKVIIAEHDK